MSDAASTDGGVGNGGTGGGIGMSHASPTGGGPSGIRVPFGVHRNWLSFFTCLSPSTLTGLSMVADLLVGLGDLLDHRFTSAGDLPRDAPSAVDHGEQPACA